MIPKTILVTSRDNDILAARTSVLETAGYSVVGALTLHGALAMADLRRPDLVVLGHTFTWHEQEEFLLPFQQTHPRAHVILLGPGFVDDLTMAAACAKCWEREADAAQTVRINGELPPTVIPWPDSM